MPSLGRLRPPLNALHLRTPTRRFSTHPPPSPPPTSRTHKYGRRIAYTTAGFGALYLADRELNASAGTRTLRTLGTFALVAADYKLNFTPDRAGAIPALHERVADRVYNLLTTNGGLYIKIGQAIGANAGLLPAPFQQRFARLFDDAPQVPYDAVARVLEHELGAPPDVVFAEFERAAVASASVAQVHRARLPDGTRVAVKVQKPAVARQVEWDLAAYRLVMWMCERWVFDLPLYFMVEYITDHLRRELDFVQEARNAQETAAYVAREPRLRERVYVPKVYEDYTTARVMTAEWIDGVRLSDRPGVRALMGEPPDPRDSARAASAPAEPALARYTSGPLKGGVKAVMQSMIDLFCAQIFDWGWVHCDPHPGNVIVRAHPEDQSRPQLVLLDHGLYVRLEEPFRREYAALWTALLSLDQTTIADVTRGWGFGAPDLFASATLMRPVRFRADPDGPEPPPLSEYEMGVRMKEKLRTFLVDTDKTPKALAFIGRNMRIVQGNNQMLGSPVNRIKVMGLWASRALVDAPASTASGRLAAWWRHIRFSSALLALDAAFAASRVRAWLAGWLGRHSEGFEDELERTMRGIAKTNFGVDVAPGVFEG